MSHLRGSVFALISVSALCFACSSDQKSTNTPNDVEPELTAPSQQPPADAPAPTGEPTNTPPAGGPPQGLN